MLKVTAVTAILTCAIALSTASARGQIPIDIVAGPTIANVSTDAYETSSSVGLFVAAGTAFPLSDRLAIMPYLGYVQKGAEFEDGSDGSYDYIEIPVLFGTQFPLNETWTLGISAGPQVAFNINCDEDGYDCSEYDDFKSTEFGIMGGAALGYPISEGHSLSFGITYDLGLTDVFGSESDYSYKNRVFYFFVGLDSLIGG